MCELTFDGIMQEARRREIPIFAVGTSDHSRMVQQFKRLADGTSGLFVQLNDIGTLIEKILSLLEKTVIVDMEVSLAVYNRRMKGLNASQIAKQIGRSESEVATIIKILEKKGAKWPTTPTDSPASGPLATVQMPVAGTIAIQVPESKPASAIGQPFMIPISNFTAQPAYQVRWMGWQGAHGYELQESSDPSFAAAKSVYSGPETSWIAKNQPTGTYYYRVRISDGRGHHGAWSASQFTVVS